MGNRIVVNKEVYVSELYFSSPAEDGGDLKSYPRRMEFEGRDYTFMDGLRYLVHKGQQMVQVFDMTDGTRDYRLKFDAAQRSWVLVDMTC